MIDGYLFNYLLRALLNINYYMRIFIFTLSFISLCWSQVSISELNKMSNDQLNLIKEEFQKQEKFIRDQGGCKQVIISWVVATFNEEMLLILQVCLWKKVG